MKKEIIIVEVFKLIASAKSRGTEQGLLVYENALRELELADSQEEVDRIRSSLNRALSGIEAHGDLNDLEYSIVKKLARSS